jgi:hypothetical protein
VDVLARPEKLKKLAQICDSRTPNENCIHVATSQNNFENKNSIFSISSLKRKI